MVPRAPQTQSFDELKSIMVCNRKERKWFPVVINNRENGERAHVGAQQKFVRHRIIQLFINFINIIAKKKSKIQLNSFFLFVYVNEKIIIEIECVYVYLINYRDKKKNMDKR